MLAPTERVPNRPSPLPVPSALLADELGPVVMADDPCEAAFESADPTGPRKYYRARSYDPKLGRFISEDPIRFGGGVNFYAYVDNNPVNNTDPYGLFRWPVPTIVPHGVGTGMTGAGAAAAAGAAGVGVVVITLVNEYEQAQALSLINVETAAANSNRQCATKKTRQELCYKALEDCLTFAGPDQDMRRKCFLAHQKCVDYPQLPVLFPHKRWVRPGE